MCFFIFSPPPFHEVHEKKSQYYNTHPGHGCIPHRWCPRVASPRTWHVQPHRWRPDLHANSGMVSAGSLGDTSQVFWGGWDVPEEKQNRMNKLGMNGIKWSTPVGSLHHTLDTVTNKTTFSWKAPQTPNCLTSPSIRIVFLTWWNSFHMMDGLNYPGVFLIFHPKKKNYPRESHLRPAVSRPPPCQCCGSTSGHGQVFNSAAEWANLWGCSEVGWRYPCSKTKNPRFFFAIPDFLGHKRWNI